MSLPASGSSSATSSRAPSTQRLRAQGAATEPSLVAMPGGKNSRPNSPRTSTPPGISLDGVTEERHPGTSLDRLHQMSNSGAAANQKKISQVII